VRAVADMEAEVKDMVEVVMVLETQGEEAVVVVDEMVVALVTVLEVKKEVT